MFTCETPPEPKPKPIQLTLEDDGDGGVTLKSRGSEDGWGWDILTVQPDGTILLHTGIGKYDKTFQLDAGGRVKIVKES